MPEDHLAAIAPKEKAASTTRERTAPEKKSSDAPLRLADTPIQPPQATPRARKASPPTAGETPAKQAIPALRPRVGLHVQMPAAVNDHLDLIVTEMNLSGWKTNKREVANMVLSELPAHSDEDLERRLRAYRQAHPSG